MRIVLLFSCLAAAFSFWAEFGWHVPSCTLCWLQRAVYLCLIPSAIIGMGAAPRLGKWLCVGLISVGLIVSAYHTLVQFHVLEDRCKGASRVQNAGDFRKLLESGGCAKIELKIAGAPASLWNSVLLAFLLRCCFRRVLPLF